MPLIRRQPPRPGVSDGEHSPGVPGAERDRAWVLPPPRNEVPVPCPLLNKGTSRRSGGVLGAVSDLGALPGGGRQRATAPFPPAWVPDAAPVRGEKGMGAVLGSPMGAPGGGRRDARTLSSSPLGHILGSWGTARVAPGRLRAPPHPPSPLPPPGATQGAKLSPRPRGRHCLIVGPGGNRISAGCVGGSRMRGSRMRAAPGGCRPVRVQASCCPPGPRGGGGLGGGGAVLGQTGRGERGGGPPPPCLHRRPPPAGSAMEESAEWGTLSPEEFAQLQKYLDCELGGGDAARVCVCVCARVWLRFMCGFVCVWQWFCTRGAATHACAPRWSDVRARYVCVYLRVGVPCTRVCVHACYACARPLPVCALPEHPCTRLCRQTAAGRCRMCCRSSMATGCCPSTCRER